MECLAALTEAKQEVQSRRTPPSLAIAAPQRLYRVVNASPFTLFQARDGEQCSFVTLKSRGNSFRRPINHDRLTESLTSDWTVGLEGTQSTWSPPDGIVNPRAKKLRRLRG